MITTMLWVVMIIWAVGIGVFYFFKSDQLEDSQTPSYAKLSDSKVSGRIGKAPSFSKPHTPPIPLKNKVYQSVKEPVTPPLSSFEKRTITTDRSLGTPTATSPPTKEDQSLLPSTRSPSPTPISAKASTKTVVKSTLEAPNKTQTPKPIQEINETSKPNGTFYSAQKITEGVIIGRRGSSGDRLDFYKITATGNSMILKLEPSLKEENHLFVMNVYNVKKQHIGKISGKTDSPLTINVTRQAIYYIGIDLGHAPIETPPYKLHVNFN